MRPVAQVPLAAAALRRPAGTSMTQGLPVQGHREPAGKITDLLRAVEGGDARAADSLFAAVYSEMRRIARRQLSASGRHGNLDTTELVHEAYLKLSHGAPWSIRDRFHFYAATARAMRQVIVDDAKRRFRSKRGSGLTPRSLDDLAETLPRSERPEELLALDEALTQLENADPELARIVEWRFFNGLSVEDIARTLEVSERTVKRHWKIARAFLFRQLSGSVPDSPA
jgi:RNA polymerase sigma factor (TIGR02999 family)